MSTTARRYWLKTLRLAGVKHFRASSGLGLPYICHIGDFAGEVPFIDRRHSIEELSVMSEWCRAIEHPVIFDIGANNGFIATQLAQLLKNRQPRIYAFEPVPSTFAQMILAVEELNLNDSVIPVCCAVSDSMGIASLAFNPRESLFAQVRDDTLNPRAGTKMATTATVTVDQIVASTGVKPDLLKIDVEGFEPRVLAGARILIGHVDPPALCFEWNPLTLREVGAPVTALKEALGGYRLHYLNDFEGGQARLGQVLDDLQGVAMVCNVFAIPQNQASRVDWENVVRNTNGRIQPAKK